MNRSWASLTCSCSSRTLIDALITTDPYASFSYTLRTVFGEDKLRAVTIKQELLKLKPISQFNSRKWRQDQSVGVVMAESLKWKLSEVQKSFLGLQKPKM